MKSTKKPRPICSTHSRAPDERKPISTLTAEEDEDMNAAIKTNMPWAVYRCEKLHVGSRHVSELNQEFVSGHLTPGEAMDAANIAARADASHSYVVGAA